MTQNNSSYPKVIKQIRKILNEKSQSGYTEWLHKIDQIERIQKIMEMIDE